MRTSDEKKLESLYENMNTQGRTPLNEWDQSEYRRGDERNPGSPHFDEPSYDEWESTAMNELMDHINGMEYIEVIGREDLDDGKYKFEVNDAEPNLDRDERTSHIIAKVKDYESDEDGNTAVIDYVYVSIDGEGMETDTFRCGV